MPERQAHEDVRWRGRMLQNDSGDRYGPPQAGNLTVYIVVEIDGGRGAIDGVHTDEAAANSRRDELNFRHDDHEFACVIAKYVKGSEGYLQAPPSRSDTP